jgi:hypothetical protein
MKKIMEKRFMFVGTLEEAEFNRVVSYLGLSVGWRKLTLSLRVGTGIMDR